MSRCTKVAVLDSLEQVIRLKRQYGRKMAERTQTKQIRARNTGIQLFLKLQQLVVLCDRLAVIEPSKCNAKALIVACLSFHNFFMETISRMQEQPNWEQVAVKQNFLEFSFTLSSCIISPDRVTLDNARADIRDQTDEQQKLRERARKVAELIDLQSEYIDEEKEITLDDAVLIVQKLERVYQAISRYNYLRHVYQQAMDDREAGKTMTDEEAIIRIQARTRGYFARKRVRELRRKELDKLGMSASSIVESMRYNVILSETLPILEEPSRSLEALLEELKDNFFPAAREDKETVRLLQRKADVEDLYRKLWARGLIKETKTPRITMNELVSDVARVKQTNSRSYDFDTRLFLNSAVLIPLALRGWYHFTHKKWLLVCGEAGTGKTAWTEALIASTGAVHIRVAPNLLIRRRARTIRRIAKYVAADPCSVVIIDRMEIFKPSKKVKTIAQNILKHLFMELESTNTFVIGMSRTDDLQPQILEMFSDILYLKPLREFQKTEMIARALTKLEDAGRLSKMPEHVGDLKKETKGKSCGKTVKIIRGRYGRSQSTN